MNYLEGHPPKTKADWIRVADVIRKVHGITQNWPQRPGWRSSTDLLHVNSGTNVDLDRMPIEGVVRCRAAWKRLSGRKECVLHGDLNAGNVRITDERVA